MMRKATVWTVKLVGKSTPMYIMTPGSSFYDLGDISTLLKVAADDAGLDKDLEIESIRKSCVAIGFTKLPNEGALALREDGTIKVNDPDRLAVMTGLPPETSSPFEGTTQTMAQQNAHDPEMTSAPLTPAAIARSVEMAPAILEAVDRAEKRRSRGPR
jgi:hypothetical protein